MFPVLLFGRVVVGGLLALGLVAARSVRRALAAETSMLRTVAAARGWRLEQLAAPVLGFRLSGRSDDGGAWELARRSTPNVANDAESSSTVWSDDAVRHALRAWPGEGLIIQCGAPGLRVQLDFVALDRATVERTVALGLALARAAPAAALSAR